ncbi:MAG: GTPase, partial [Christensenellales bacterium]
KTVRLGGLIKNGAYVAIVGATNAGKSSLLNALAGEDRAIVSEQHGTTRDTVEISLNYRDLKMTFADTAGFRKTSDFTESQGIERSLRAARRASAVVFLREGLKEKSLLAEENETLGTDCPVLNVFSKNDIYRYDKTALGKDDIAISSATGENIEQLKEKIYALLTKDLDNGFVITNLRHADCLRRASEALGNALDALSAGLTLDCAAQDVKTARKALGEITGDTADNDIIDRIFSRFCLGK